MRTLYSILHRIMDLTLQHNIQYNSLRLNEFSDNDWYNMELLYEALYLKTKVKLKKDINSLFIITKIADIKFVLLLAKQKSPNEYKLFDVFDNLYWLNYSSSSKPKEDEVETAPAFVFLKTDDIVNSSNISYKSVKSLLNELSKTKIKFDISLVNNLTLNLLNAYDKTAEENILQIALVTSEWLLTKDSNDLYLLNYFQTKYRSKSLNRNDLNYLESILKKYSTRNYEADSEEAQILFGCNVLLENRYFASTIFKGFSTVLKNLYKEYPIYNLYR